MARKKKSKLDELESRIEQVGGFEAVAIDDLKREYASLNGMLVETREAIERDGVMVEREVGTVNNRHTAIVENERVKTYKRLLDMQTALSKTVIALKRSPKDEDGHDEFDEF